MEIVGLGLKFLGEKGEGREMWRAETEAQPNLEEKVELKGVSMEI